jgi:hypothetical protein
MKMESERNGAVAPTPKWKGISGSALKMLAVVTMLVDHIAAAVLVRIMYAGGDFSLYEIYFAMRQIGRIAFPIYCFMLVEGMEHTKNKWKYAGRLGALALLSEIPFDLAFSSKVLEFGYQNVFFTLVIGLLTVMAVSEIEKRSWLAGNAVADRSLRTAAVVLVSAAGMGLAAFLRTDYGWCGIACILVLYFLRGRRWLELAAGYLAFVVLLGEVAALPAFLALALYRGRKGFSCKAFFYGFYPVHLLLLYLVCVLLGVAAYPAI